MRQRMQAGAGFSLLEIILSLLILSVVTAFVVPQVMEKGDEADAPRVQADLAEISTAIELFRLDVTKPAGDLEDLVKPISPADLNLIQRPFSFREAERWDGPYIKTAIKTGPLKTGYKGIIQERFRIADGSPMSNADSVMTLPETRAYCHPGNYIAIEVRNINPADFEVINDLIDGPEEPDGDAGSRILGQLRYTSATPPLMYYLVRPCR